MRLYLVRHGETIENLNGIIQGQAHGTLSAKGKEQIQRLAERLRNEEFDCIYCSDLARAKDTAIAIHKHHQKVQLLFVKELRERDFGPYEGKRCEEMGLVRGKDWGHLPPEVESTAALRKRCEAFIKAVYNSRPDGTILFVSHGGTINALLSVIVSRSGEEIDFIPLHNTSITIVEFDEDKKHTIHLLNCVQHLE